MIALLTVGSRAIFKQYRDILLNIPIHMKIYFLFRLKGVELRDHFSIALL